MDNKRPELVQQGTEAFEQHNWKEAVYYLGQAAMIENGFDINRPIVESLIKIGKYEDAVDQASVFLDRYLDEKEDAKFLFSILIETQEFIMTHQLLEVVKSEDYTNLSDAEIKQIIADINNEEQKWLNDNFTAKEYEQQEKELLSLVTMPSGVQAVKIREMKYLPLNNFLNISENLLLNPYLHPIFKNEVIENLVKLKLDKTYGISYYGELREFNPSKLTTLMFSPEYKHARKVLHDKLVDRDGSEAGLMSGEFLLYISLSYPFINETITNMDEWVEVYINRHDQKNIEPTANNEKIATWLDRYSKLLETFEN